MLIQNVFMNGLSGVSAQATFDEEFLTGTVKEPSFEYAGCVEPEYKNFLNPTASRRFSRIIKMSLVAAQKSLAMADNIMPEAIITGTGLGCLEDTEKFLSALIVNNESMLSPTAFIQSTHNTLSGQIAMMIKCYHPNYTYSNRYFSFESSLLDGLLMLQDKSCKHVMVNAADEVIPAVHNITKRMGMWDRHESIASNAKMPVTIGEGVVSMILSSEKQKHTLAQVKAFSVLYKLPEGSSIEEQMNLFLADAALTIADIDVVILGLNGNSENDAFYAPVQKVFNQSTQLVYKHLFGESFTASAFSYWLAAHMIHNQNVIEQCILSDKGHRKPKNILIYNQYKNTYHSFCLLTDVEV
jgi:3-oxoacyl-[acyl-carrier-protein] synthase II